MTGGFDGQPTVPASAAAAAGSGAVPAVASARPAVAVGQPAGDAGVDEVASAQPAVTVGQPAGDAGVDEVAAQVGAALGELDVVAGWPPDDQVAAFTAAHQTLQATLARIDDH